MPKSRWMGTGVAVGLTLVGACHAADFPPSVDASNTNVFVLRSIAGQALPAPYAPNPASDRKMIADTLVLRRDGSGEWRAVYENGDGGTWRQRSLVTYRDQAGRIEVDFQCEDHASCIEPPHLVGTLSESGLIFHVSRITRAPLLFERVLE